MADVLVSTRHGACFQSQSHLLLIEKIYFFISLFLLVPGSVDFITALPPELALHVLSFVPLAEVGSTLSLVSQAWKRSVQTSGCLWVRRPSKATAYPEVVAQGRRR
jgi:hypothetical protein